MCGSGLAVRAVEEEPCLVQGWLCVLQGWEFVHLLIAHLLICSFRSNQMSDCERFAQIAQDN